MSADKPSVLGLVPDVDLFVIFLSVLSTSFSRLRVVVALVYSSVIHTGPAPHDAGLWEKHGLQKESFMRSMNSNVFFIKWT